MSRTLEDIGVQRCRGGPSCPPVVIVDAGPLSLSGPVSGSVIDEKTIVIPIAISIPMVDPGRHSGLALRSIRSPMVFRVG